jgi:spore cortex formation protein SpoVR/YcgB (stage V sporulation)
MTARAQRRQPISTGSEWTFELIQTYDREIGRLAERYALDTYPNQIEVITAEQMMDAYASVGMPLGYHHWSYGKQFLSTEKSYSRGQMGLAYEIVINSDPCIAYLMEENTMCMQALVIAHACYGHNSFFKGNYLFRTWTDASSIIDYLVFAKQYIAQCEERHGIDAVEDLIDSCHALMNYGVDRYKRPYPISAEEERRRQKEREEHLQRQINDLWRTIPKSAERGNERDEGRFPAEPQENILYFIEKNAPLLEPWQREVVRIVRKIAQYFYPQRQTQVMTSHTSVVFQPGFDSPYYSGINPYALGFAMYTDIRRMCENPTDEDRHWFPDIAGSDWLSTIKFAMSSFKDESFILQYLSPKVMRDLKLFSILDDDQRDDLLVPAIHDEAGYRVIREMLAAQYNLGNREPNVQIWSVDRRGDRSLTLRHQQHNRKPLGDSTDEVLKHLHRLWGFDIHLETVQGEQVMKTHHMPPRGEHGESADYGRMDLAVIHHL